MSWHELLAEKERNALEAGEPPSPYIPRGESFNALRFAACAQPGIQVKLIDGHPLEYLADQAGVLISNQVDEGTPPINFIVEFFIGEDELLRADELLYWVNEAWLTFEQLMDQSL